MGEHWIILAGHPVVILSVLGRHVHVQPKDHSSDIKSLTVSSALDAGSGIDQINRQQVGSNCDR